MVEKVWTADELERLTPAEQDAIFDASVVNDLAARVRRARKAEGRGADRPA